MDTPEATRKKRLVRLAICGAALVLLAGIGIKGFNDLLNGNNNTFHRIATLTPSRLKAERLIRRLQSKNPEEARKAEAAISGMTGASEIKAIVYCMGDGYGGVGEDDGRMIALLAKIGEPAIQPLIDVAVSCSGGNGPFWQRGFPEAGSSVTGRRLACARAASQVLTRIGDPAVDALSKVLARPGREGEWAAKEALVGMKCPAAAKVLAGRVMTVSGWARVDAMNTLVRQGSPLGADAMADAIAHDDGFGSADLAAIGLGRLSDRRGLDRLLKVLKDPQYPLRTQAAQALGNFTGREVQTALVAALGDDVNAVREAAAQSLGKVGDRSALDALHALEKDRSEAVRSAAANAVRAIEDRIARGIDSSAPEIGVDSTSAR